MGLGVMELLGKTEIDDIDLISTLSNAHEEVVRFDITMNEVSRVDIFNGVGGCGTCHSSLLISQRNLIGVTDLLPSVVIRCKIHVMFHIQSPESQCRCKTACPSRTI